MSASSETLRLLRLERLRWQTGWANALASPRREDRLHVVRAVLAVAAAGSVLLWLATRAFEAAGAAGAADLSTGAAVASLFAAILFADGLRRGRTAGEADRLSEEWMVAVGIGTRARAARDTAAALLATLPYCWVPLLGLAGTAPGAGAAHRLLLVLPGLAASVAGYGLGSATRVLRQPARIVVLAAVSAWIALAIGCVAAYAADPAWARAHGLETPARGIWPILLSGRGVVVLPLLGAAAMLLAWVARDFTLRRLGWAPFDVPVRSAAPVRTAVGAQAGLRPMLVRRERARLLHGVRREALPLALVAAGTLAAFYVKSLRAGADFLDGSSLSWTVGFATLLPAIMLVEIAWADEDPESRAYVRAVSGAEALAARVRTGLVLLGLSAWQLTLSAAAGGITGAWGAAAAHALLAIAASAGAVSLGTAAAALALRSGSANSGFGRLLRYAATAAGAGLGPVALGRSGSPLLTAALCLLCLAAAVPLASWWLRRSELHPAPQP